MSEKPIPSPFTPVRPPTLEEQQKEQKRLRAQFSIPIPSPFTTSVPEPPRPLQPPAPKSLEDRWLDYSDAHGTQTFEAREAWFKTERERATLQQLGSLTSDLHSRFPDQEHGLGKT